MLLLAIIWMILDQLEEYCLTIFILFLVRTSSGGIHFKSYNSCLFASFLYLLLCINVLPSFKLPSLIKLVILVICIPVAFIFSPIVSKYRVPPSKAQKRRSKYEMLVITVFYLGIMFLFSDNPLINIGFWCITLHTLQLLITYILIKIKTKLKYRILF